MKRTIFFTACTVSALLITLNLLAQNVGIGTNTPTQQLDVNGNLRVRGLSHGAQKAMINADAMGNMVLQPVNNLDYVRYSPTVVSVTTVDYSAGMAASGDKLYIVSSSTSRLSIYDIYAPENPTLRSTIATTGTPSAVAVNGSTVYVVNNSTNTLQAFNCTNPFAPQLLSTTPTGAAPAKVAVEGNRVYVLNGQGASLQVFDCSNPAAPILTGTASTASNPVSLVVSNSIAYVGNSVGGPSVFQIFDCSNAAVPQLKSTTQLTSNVSELAISGSVLYIANVSGDDIVIFDCQNLTQPVFRSSFTRGIQAPYIALSGISLYLTGSTTSNLYGFDCSIITDPTERQYESSLLPGSLKMMVAHNGLLIVVTQTAGPTAQLRIFRMNHSLLTQNPDGSFSSISVDAGGFKDNLGSHKATQNLNLANHQLVGYGGNSGITIAANGDVGIGTVPHAPLQFSSALTNRKIVLQEGANNDHEFNGFGVALGELRYQVKSTTTDHAFFVGTSSTTSQELMRITGTGRVGIGTATPTQRLDVAGNAVVSGNVTVSSNLTVGGTVTVGSIGQETVQAASLQSSWMNTGSGFTTAGFYKDKENRVHLQGLIRLGTNTSGTLLFTLPVGYRPLSGRLLFTVDNNGAAARIDVLPDGSVLLMNSSTNLALSLSGISFRAD
jgi:hypothetical protein